MKNRVFLGGTCGGNNWREGFMARLVMRGVSRDALFNPVVPDWNQEVQKLEEEAKAHAPYLVFYIADPKQEGNPLSGYSMVEATMALYDKPHRTVVVFDTEWVSDHPLKAMNQTLGVLKARFPNANIFGTRQEAEDWLVNKLAH